MVDGMVDRTVCGMLRRKVGSTVGGMGGYVRW